jgi:hypothetical protein
MRYAITPKGGIAMAAASFAGAKAEKLLLGLEATGVLDDLMMANRWCQTQDDVGACLDSSLKLADAVILNNVSAIKKLAELVMNQPPDKNGKRKVDPAEVEALITPLLIQAN